MDVPTFTSFQSFAPTPPAHSMGSSVASPSSMLPHQQSQDNTDRARVYKSRNRRPCDFCRYKKAACHLESQPPCELCIRYKKECTFVESPAKRRRPNENQVKRDSRSSTVHSNGHERNGSTQSVSTFSFGYIDPETYFQQDFSTWSNGIELLPFTTGMSDVSAMEFPLDPAFYNEPGVTFDMFERVAPSTSTISQTDDGFRSFEQHDLLADTTSECLAYKQQLTNQNELSALASTDSSLELQHQYSSQIVGPRISLQATASRKRKSDSDWKATDRSI